MIENTMPTIRVEFTAEVVKDGAGYGLAIDGVVFDTGYATQEEAQIELDRLVAAQSTKH